MRLGDHYSNTSSFLHVHVPRAAGEAESQEGGGEKKRKKKKKKRKKGWSRTASKISQSSRRSKSSGEYGFPAPS